VKEAEGSSGESRQGSRGTLLNMRDLEKLKEFEKYLV